MQLQSAMFTAGLKGAWVWCDTAESWTLVNSGDLGQALSKYRRYGEPMKSDIGDTDSADVDVFTPSGHFQREIELRSSQRFMGGNDPRASANAIDKTIGSRVVPPANCDLVPVFEDPVYQRSERVAARKVQFATCKASLYL
jgi:hypothetical protein